MAKPNYIELPDSAIMSVRKDCCFGKMTGRWAARQTPSLCGLSVREIRDDKPLVFGEMPTRATFPAFRTELQVIRLDQQLKASD
jgi:hypothetical protein